MPIKILKKDNIITELEGNDIIIRRINEDENVCFGVTTYQHNYCRSVEIRGSSYESLEEIVKILESDSKNLDEISSNFGQILEIKSNKTFNFYGKVLVEKKLRMPISIHRIYFYDCERKIVKELSLITNIINIHLNRSLLEIVANLDNARFKALREPLIVKNFSSKFTLLSPRILVENDNSHKKLVEATQLIVDFVTAIEDGKAQRFIMPILDFFDWNSESIKVEIKSEVGDLELHLPKKKKSLKKVIDLIEFENVSNLEVLVTLLFDKKREFIARPAQIKSLIISHLS